MKNTIKLSMLAVVASLAVGCASTSDVENLQSQVDGLNSSVAQASADAASARTTAADASSRAQAAEASANRSAQLSQDANSKLSRKFRRSMMK